MAYRPLGNTGLTVSEVGFGAWQLGSSAAWGEMPDRDALALVAAARDAGCNLFDTAPNYGRTQSETLLGRALHRRRQDTVIVSKFGHRPDDDIIDFSLSWFWESLHQSLERLRTDYLDVYLAHSPPREVLTPEHGIWEALRQARKAGKIRAFGASVDRSEEVFAAAGIEGLAVVEVLFNALQQEVRYAFPLAKAKGLGVIAKVPLDSGWLSGRYSAKSCFAGIRGRWTRDDIARRANSIEALRDLLPAGQALPEAAIAFILGYDAVSSTIPGARSLKQLQGNARCAGKQLAPALKSRIEEFWEDITDHGRKPLPW